MVDAPFGTDANPLPPFRAEPSERVTLRLERAVYARPPADLESLSVGELIGIVRSMIRLNRSLVTGYNQTAKTFETLGTAMGDALTEWAEFAERLEAAEQAAAGQASETSAAADWPGSVRNT